MRTREECWIALLDGKSLYNRNDIEVRIIDGDAKTVKTKMTIDFISPKNWHIKEDKKLSLQEMYVSLLSVYKALYAKTNCVVQYTEDKINRMANIHAVKNTTRMWKKQF